MEFLGTLVVWSIKPLKITAINRKCKLVRPSLLPYDAQDVNSKKDAQAFVAASRNLSCTCLIYYGLTYSFFVLCWYIYIYISSTGAAYIHSFFPLFRVALSIWSTTMTIIEFLSSVFGSKMFGYESFKEVKCTYHRSTCKANLANVWQIDNGLNAINDGECLDFPSDYVRDIVFW